MSRRRRHRKLLETLQSLGWHVEACYVRLTVKGCCGVIGGRDRRHIFYRFGAREAEHKGFFLPPFPQSGDLMVFIVTDLSRERREVLDGWRGLSGFVHREFNSRRARCHSTN